MINLGVERQSKSFLPELEALKNGPGKKELKRAATRKVWGIEYRQTGIHSLCLNKVLFNVSGQVIIDSNPLHLTGIDDSVRVKVKVGSQDLLFWLSL